MGRKQRAPRLWLRPERKRKRDGSTEQAVWIIRDGSGQISTGCGEAEKAEAEDLLRNYLMKSGPAQKHQQYYVYFLTTKRKNFPIKIGITASRLARFSALQTSLPYEIDVIGFWPVQDQFAERELHKRFREDRLRGEWFSRSEALMAFIRSLDFAPAITIDSIQDESVGEDRSGGGTASPSEFNALA